MSPEEYKIEQQKRAASHKVGALDQSGLVITKIFARGDQYVIYEIDSTNSVDSIKVWIDTIVEDDNVPINNYLAIREKFNIAKGLLYKCIDKAATKAGISHIVVSAIEGHPTSANDQLDRLIKEVNLEYEEQFKNRMRLLMSSFILSAILIGISAYVHFTLQFQNNFHFRNLMYVAAGGSVGGFFSISIGVNKIICEKDVATWLYLLYGAERIIISILAASIAYFAIQTNLAFGLAKDLTNPTLGYVFFAILAGFSETMIPNILTKVEKET